MCKKKKKNETRNGNEEFYAVIYFFIFFKIFSVYRQFYLSVITQTTSIQYNNTLNTIITSG